MRKRALVSTTLLLSSLILSGGTGFAADNEVKEKNINIKISAAIPTSLPVLKTIHDFAENLSTMSNGSIKAKVYDPGKLVPAMEIHDAVSKGQVTAGYTFSMYLAGKIPASPLFASMPFGPSANAYTAWLFEGNGLDLYQRMYDEAGYNVKVFPIGISDTESGGWFRQEINTVEDLKGLRLRWPALGGKVMSKLGASVSTISIAEVFPALEKGAVDGTECGLPLVDAPLGFWKVAKYNYFPGWHQTSTVFEFIINKKSGSCGRRE